MKSDTLIGIVGSVLLVGIIIGVFIYEYNNVEPQDLDALQREAFERGSLGFLAAADDIDNDGELNYLDDDIDGDGIPNRDDDLVQREITFSGSHGVAEGDVGSHTTQAYEGIATVEVQLTASPTAPALLAGVYSMELSINGTVVDTGPSPLQATATPGLVQVDITTDAVATLGGEYSGKFVLTYGP